MRIVETELYRFGRWEAVFICLDHVVCVRPRPPEADRETSVLCMSVPLNYWDDNYSKPWILASAAMSFGETPLLLEGNNMSRNQRRACFWARFMPTLRLKLWIMRKLDPAPVPYPSAGRMLEIFEMLGGMERLTAEANKGTGYEEFVKTFWDRAKPRAGMLRGRPITIIFDDEGEAK